MLEVQVLKENFLQEKIKLINYFYDIRATHHDPPSTLFQFANTFLLLLRQYPHLNVFQFFDSMSSQFAATVPNSQHALFQLENDMNLNFVVNSFCSLQQSFLKMRENGKVTKDTSNYFNQVLSSLFLDNDCAAKIPDSQLAKWTYSTKYYVSHARKTVEVFQNDHVDDFNRIFEERTYYTQDLSRIVGELVENDDNTCRR